MNQRFHIHAIVKFFYPVAAGIETNMMETYSDLATQNWDITVHTSTNTLTEHRVLPQTETIRGLQIQRYPWHWWGYQPHFQIDEPSLIALHNFNIFPHLWLMLQSGWHHLTGQKKYRLVLTPHGGFTPEWGVFTWPSRIVKWLYHRTVAVWLINHTVDGIRAVSTWEQQEMAKYGIRPQLIRVISNGIEDQAFANNATQVSADFKHRVQQLGRYIIQIGRIHQIKNLTTSIQVLATLPTDIKLIIAGPVGEPEYLAKLQALADQLGVTDRVIFWGVVRGAEKFYLLSQAELMLHMAIWESYCNVVHEAMSQGLVCIVADNTALPLLIKNGVNGYCLPATDTPAIAAKINFILDPKNATIKSKIESHNRQAVKAHSWSRVAVAMGEYYLELLKQANV